MGSEMCIRDRAAGAAQTDPAVEAEDLLGAAAQVGNVPPAVLAAAAAQTEPVVETEDLLGGDDDFEAWDGDVPPARRLHAEIHAEMDAQGSNVAADANVTTRRGRAPSTDRRAKAEEDKISVAGSVSDVTPPPNFQGTHLSLIHI